MRSTAGESFLSCALAVHASCLFFIPSASYKLQLRRNSCDFLVNSPSSPLPPLMRVQNNGEKSRMDLFFQLCQESFFHLFLILELSPRLVNSCPQISDPLLPSFHPFAVIFLSLSSFPSISSFKSDNFPSRRSRPRASK